MRLYLDVRGSLDWEHLSRSLLDLYIDASSPLDTGRVGDKLLRVLESGARFPDTDRLARCLATAEAVQLTVGPIPLDLDQDTVLLKMLTGLAVRQVPGHSIDRESAAFLAAVASSQKFLEGTIDWVRDERNSDGVLLFRWVGLKELSSPTVPGVLLSTNIDDMTPESLGYVMGCLLQEGARDAWIVPITMKKSRPAVTLHVLTAPDQEDRLLERLFSETTTLGVRRSMVEMYILDRRSRTVTTRYGPISVK